MKLQGETKFSADRETVWQVLNSPEALKNCTPGCKELIQIDEDTYETKMEIGVAAIKGVYEGKINLTDKVYPEQFTLQIHAEGSVGVVDATARLVLKENGEHTLLQYEGDAQLGGLIAGVGQRMLSGVAKMMVGQFFKSMAKEIV
ncbi:SRPBCC family protein [Brevibacillus sp. TJ4]|uniref:SRPBCC family protein n=1 Tax=Brevibacillus sp. TJ4 TaxID=3234853 RepID=UPI003B9E2A7E